MNPKNTKWILLIFVFLAASITASDRSKPDQRGQPHPNSRPSAAESQKPKPQPPAALSDNSDKPQNSTATSENPSRIISFSTAQAAPNRILLPRTVPTAATQARPSPDQTESIQPATQKQNKTADRPVSSEKTAHRTVPTSPSKPADKQNASKTLPAESKTLLRPPSSENQPSTQTQPQADNSLTSSARSPSRLNTSRRVIIANRSSEQYTQRPQENSDKAKETQAANDKSKPDRPLTPRSMLTSKSIKSPTDTKNLAPARLTDSSQAVSDRSSPRVIASKIERPNPPGNRDSRPKTVALSASPATQPTRSESPNILQADELASPSRHDHGKNEKLSRPEIRRDHKDQYDSKITITPEKKIVIVGDITPHHPRPYIPPRLHPDLVIVRSSPNWQHSGSYFSLTFSLNSCARLACVPYRSCWGLTYYYPRYHRRYVFVSIGGWWPYEYRYIRYYWYGCHPYYWYGPTVISPAPVLEQNTYNTYNYYGSTAVTSQKSSTAWKYPFGDTNYDVSGYIEKISAPDAPQFQTAADLCFDRAVNLFLTGKYAEAADQFREAIRISPEDIILPFTYSQALLADGDYARAAAVLRSAVLAVPDDQLTIYYPRGLYDKEETLLAQIQALQKAAEEEPFAADFYLLLGYQYIGMEQYDKAAEYLEKAAKDPANQPAAQKLLDLLAQLQQPEDD